MTATLDKKYTTIVKLASRDSSVVVTSTLVTVRQITGVGLLAGPPGPAGVGGGFDSAAIQTADFTAAISKYYPVDATDGPITVTLPTGSGITQIVVKKIDNSANLVTISGTFDGVAGTTTISAGNQTKLFVADGVGGWNIYAGGVSANNPGTTSAEGKAVVISNGKTILGRSKDHMARAIVIGSSRAIGDGTQPFTNGLVQQKQNSWFTHFCWGGQQVRMIRNAGIGGDIIGAQTTLSQDAHIGDTVLHINTFRGAYPPTSLGVHIYTGKKGSAEGDDNVILSVNTGAQTLTLNTPLLKDHDVGTSVGWGFVSRLETDVLDFYPDVVFEECGGANDVNTTSTSDQLDDLVYWLQYMSETMRERGIDVIHTVEPGRPFFFLNDSVFAKKVVQWLNASHLDLLDFRPLLSDANTNKYIAAYSDDGVHVNMAGAQAQAQMAIDWWHQHRQTRGDYIPLTTYDADPWNMLAFGTMSGSSNTSTLPQGWTAAPFFSSGQVVSIVDPSDATTDPYVKGKLWKVVMSGSGNGTYSIKQTINPSSTTWAPGDKLVMGWWMKASGFANGTYTVGILYDGDASVHECQNAWSIDYEGRIWCEAITVPANATTVKFFITVGGSGSAGTGTFWIGQPTVRNITKNGITYEGQF